VKRPPRAVRLYDAIWNSFASAVDWLSVGFGMRIVYATAAASVRSVSASNVEKATLKSGLSD
jgi:hypothetical protein